MKSQERMLTNVLETEYEQDCENDEYRNFCALPYTLCTHPYRSSFFSRGPHILITTHYTFSHAHRSTLETESLLMFTCKHLQS